MNYRHAFHAGNFADVLKHAVLARILHHLGDKPAPYRVLDTHAGAALYDLDGPEASRTGEWRDGIGRLRDAAMPPAVAALLAPYLDVVTALSHPGALRYPGSPRLALELMRPQDRLVACELEPAAAAALAHALGRDARAKAVAIDGWLALKAYIPPKERRGLVVIDPPFEQPDEFSRLAHGIVNAVRKWPTGVYLIWYPVKERRGPAGLVETLVSAGIPKLLRVELDVGGRDDGLRATGLVLINPPWRLADELAVLLNWLVPVLSRGGGAGSRLDRIAAT
ncbi:23S rRNA (adenine(2030)-N(6))-methyltransferase RlmJ [Rhodoplanes sp. TEM]|uniref:Ribosomal RNA large subunit methyltransferase J n=1 Tax=Rhodoplanes tepidamans TaxID=200616 RepID=A0ABT5JIP1_RHOTP|nr:MULTISPECIES: 23S rRNA (adenine(2030)-N(6))-methyltransferase RlmJ [Rhodoplanes]MDC7789477.1 23S rRNA (adenine(2030)-N(6))-methyltransferase RlmJ [Rhodoplanes tepidamans]MDC7986107.1 23S rRNA (adenine(2030)-N(6))-methyltransferase RlmJ [Rhodoplanes sp. TEM]MDQ0358894.1 23S rRNA (adenine2030-N6)-methyltransferase [Rhodoplanes tepidamans]